ncbi:hypothetical protein [Streptomyces sp. NPDC029674]|uniref:hypothetical protein n=1 Tax=Streptomyces sp. NPDC029674 TaxID=3365297 RepID=UPI00384ECF90
MKIRLIDPRDTTWERQYADFRVYFWDLSAHASHAYAILAEVDVGELLSWAEEYAAGRGWTYTLYAAVTDSHGPGLIRLAGVADDPFDDR